MCMPLHNVHPRVDPPQTGSCPVASENHAGGLEIPHVNANYAVDRRSYPEFFQKYLHRLSPHPQADLATEHHTQCTQTV